MIVVLMGMEQSQKTRKSPYYLPKSAIFVIKHFYRLEIRKWLSQPGQTPTRRDYGSTAESIFSHPARLVDCCASQFPSGCGQKTVEQAEAVEIGTGAAAAAIVGAEWNTAELAAAQVLVQHLQPQGYMER